MRKLLTISGAILTLLLLLLSGCHDNSSRIVFFSRPAKTNNLDIYSMKPDGSDRVRLAQWSPHSMPYHNVWSAGGKTLVYIDTDNATQTNWRSWLSVVSGDGQNPRRLLDLTDLKMNSMALSPDGKTVVLSMDSTRVIQTPQGGTVHVEVAGDLDLFTVDVKTGKLTKLTDTPDVKEKFPSYSPDGKQIAFVGQIDTEILRGVPQEVYVMDADGNNRRHIAHHSDGLGFVSPAELLWSPTGSKIAYVFYNVSISDSEHYTDIFIINVNTGTLTNLTDSPYTIDDAPSWSPDGRKIAYYSGNVTEGYHTRVMDIAGGMPTMLDQRISSWAPDGKGLIFTNPLNVFELMVVDIDGKNQRTLAVSKDISISNPFWLAQ